MNNLEKRLGNLLKKLRVDENSVLFAKGDELNERTVNKLAKSRYDKDTVLLNLYREFKKNGGKIKELKTKVVINTPFVQERAVTQRGKCYIRLTVRCNLCRQMWLISTPSASLSWL